MAMQLRTWRIEQGLTLRQLGQRMGEKRQLRSGERAVRPYHFRTVHRYEIGETEVPAEVRQDIIDATDGAVQPNDMHATRMAYLADRSTTSGKGVAGRRPRRGRRS